MDNVPELPWGKIAAVTGALVTIHLTIRGVVRVASIATNEVRYRLASGRLPKRRG